MDAAHEADLARILENRRRRGVSAPYQSSRHYGRFPESAGREPREIDEPSVTTRSPLTDSVLGRNVQRISPSPITAANDGAQSGSPRLSVSDRRYVSGSPRQTVTSMHSPVYISSALNTPSHVQQSADVAALAEEQRNLKQSLMSQDRKVDEISRNMNRNFNDLMRALHPTGAISSNVNNTRVHSPIRASGSDLNRVIGESAPLEIAGQSVRADGNRGGARLGTGTLPPPLAFPKGRVAAAAPSSASHLDLKSAMAVLKAGEWFIKWDGARIEAAARFVWYDYPKCCMFWGPEKFTRTVLGGYMPLEQITSVTTDQLMEFDGDVDRLFFLLIVHSPKRTLYLATEKRAKLDCWYEALTIISLYNRMQRAGGANRGVSSD